MIDIDVVTPSRQVIQGAKVESLKLPAAKGEMQVLQGHTDFLTLLRSGVMTFESEGTQRNFAISYGFAEIHKDRILVLAETCEESKEIDRERAQKAQQRAEEALTSSISRAEFTKFERKLQRALIRQQACKV